MTHRLLDYQDRMQDWVEDHMQPIKPGSKLFTTVGVEREVMASEAIILDYLWTYATNHSDEVLA